MKFKVEFVYEKINHEKNSLNVLNIKIVQEEDLSVGDFSALLGHLERLFGSSLNDSI